MEVIEALRTSILEPRDHLRINQMSAVGVSKLRPADDHVSQGASRVSFAQNRRRPWRGLTLRQGRLTSPL
jgi:hypothetical protein